MFHRKSVKSQSQASFVFSPLFPGSSCRSFWNEEEAENLGLKGCCRLPVVSQSSPTPFPLCEVDDLVKANLVKMTISTTALAASPAPAALDSQDGHLEGRAPPVGQGG